jgi:peptidoglycan/xylan/chitin deacetylase (PgdA/CDA1 family)
VDDDTTGTASPQIGLKATTATSVVVTSGDIWGATTSVSDGGGNGALVIEPSVSKATGHPTPTRTVAPGSASLTEVTTARNSQTDLNTRLNLIESRSARERDLIQTKAVVSHFGSGHGWTSTGLGGGTNLNDTSTITGLSGQSVKMQSNGATSPQKLSKSGMTAADLSVGNAVRIWLYGPNMKDFSEFKLRAAGTGGLAGGNYIEWPILGAGTGVLATSQFPIPQNTLAPLVLSYADATIVGSPTRSAITEWEITCQDDGTTTTMNLVGIDIVGTGSGGFGTTGVVSITFDDGYISQYTIAKHVLADYGYQATFLPIVDRLGASGSFMSIGQLQNLERFYQHEVGVHANTLTNHDGYGSLTSIQAEADMRAAFEYHAANGIGRDNFAYPGGHFTPFDIAAAKLFTCGRTTGPTGFEIRHESLAPQNRLRLKSISRVGGVGGVPVSDFTDTDGYLDQCADEKTWLIITLHNITAGAAASAYDCSQSDLSALLAGIESRGLTVATLGQVMRGISSTPVEQAPLDAHDHSGADEGGLIDLRPPSWIANNLKAANMADVDISSSATTVTASTNYVFKMYTPHDTTVANVLFWLNNAGATLSGWYTALYNASGSLFAGTGSTDQSSKFTGATGVAISLPLGASAAVPAGTFYVALQSGTLSTAPQIYRGASNVGNFNVTTAAAAGASAPRWGTAANAWSGSTPPSTLGTITPVSTAFLCAVA